MNTGQGASSCLIASLCQSMGKMISATILCKRSLTTSIYKCMVLFVVFACFPSFANDSAFVINGLDDHDIEDNVSLHLRQLPAFEQGANADLYANSIKKKVKTAVQAFAFYNAAITVVPTNAQEEADSKTLWNIDIVLNAPAIVNRVVLVNDLETIDGEAMPEDITDVLAQITAFKDLRLEHEKYESAKSRLKALALFYGFFDFSFPLHKLAITPNADNTASTALIHWIFFFGKRYKFGDVEYLEFTDAEPLVNEVVTFDKGDFFEQSKVSQFSIDLQNTNYFERAVARANAEKSQDFFVPIEVILAPKPRDKYNVGIGVSTDTGPRFTTEWQRPWVNLDGHALTANLFLSRPRQSIEMGYRIPKGNPLKDFIDVQLGYKLVDENQTNSKNLSLSLLRQYGAKHADAWDFIPFVRFSQESFKQGIDVDSVTTRLLTPGVTYSRVRKRGDILVTWGDRQQITLMVGSKSFVSDIDVAKLQIQTKWVREAGRHRFIFRAEAGAIATNDFDRLPASERFFTGGDQSIRGFGLNEISDFNEQIDEKGETTYELIGGRYLSVGSAEYVYAINESWQAAAFVDAGSASDEFAKDIAHGVGLGVHWLSPIGRVRLYLARGESELKDRNDWRFHLNIGPAL